MAGTLARYPLLDLLFLLQRMDIRYEGLDLIVRELRGRHLILSVLDDIGDLGIRELEHFRRRVRLGSQRLTYGSVAEPVWAMAHFAFRFEDIGSRVLSEAIATRKDEGKDDGYGVGCAFQDGLLLPRK